ncbi:MAG: TolC family protein [Bradymonadaceae bacterium]
MVILLAMTCAPVFAQAEEMPKTPREYERFALEHHPALRAQQHIWRGSLKEAEAVESRWPQPMLGYNAEIGTFWSPQVGVTHMAMVSQTVPWPGVLDKMAEPARRQAVGEQERFDGLARQIVHDVRVSLVDIARIDALDALLGEQRELYEEAVLILEATMATGRADYGDILRLTTAAEMLADRQDMLRSRREQSVASLREFLDVEPNTPLQFEFEGAESPLEVREQRVDVGAALAQMSEHHPELATLRAQGARADAQGAAARSRRMPWPTVSLGYGNMPMMGGEGREDMFLVGFSIPLPIFARQYSAEVERFELQRSAFQEQERATSRRLAAQIEASATRIDESMRRLARFRTELLPLAGDVTERMLIEMELGRRTATDYLLAVQQQLELESSLIELKATIARELARLNLLTGGEFEAQTTRGFERISIEEVGGRR